MIGRWGDDTALVRTDAGATVEAPVPEALRDHIDVGASVTVTDSGDVDWQPPDSRN